MQSSQLTPVTGAIPPVRFMTDARVLSRESDGNVTLTVPVSVNDKVFSITVGYNEERIREKYRLGSTDKVDEVVLKVIDILNADEILAMAGKDLEEGIGSQGLKIKRVEEKPATPVDSAVSEEKHILHQKVAQAVSKWLEPIQKKEQVLLSKAGGMKTPAIAKQEAEYLQSIQREISSAENSLRGANLRSRYEGAEKFTGLRRKLAFELFQKVVQPKVEELMRESGDHRNFNDVVTIYGFNRLFTRTKASVGTDIDFMLVIDTKDETLVAKIRDFLKKEIAPEIKGIGIDMETADYLMIGLSEYQEKLDRTRSSLFTLANMFNPLKTQDNVSLIAGSEKILKEQVFTFTNKQLAEHYAVLLENHGDLKEGEVEAFKTTLFKKLESKGAPFRNQVIDHLQKMANSQLYIGKKPYFKKQTVQTIMGNPDLARKRTERTMPFSIKFCLNRMGDLINATTLKPEDCSPKLNQDQLNAIEGLGTLLSNIVSYQASGPEAPIILQEGYSDITLEQIKEMSFTDRALVTQLMSKFDIELDPYSDHFPEECYDGLWTLGDKIYSIAIALENKIYTDASDTAKGT